MSDFRQVPNDGRFFVPVSSLAYSGSINELNRTNGTLQTAAWLFKDYTSHTGNPGAEGTTATTGGSSSYLSSIKGPGAGKLRDLGKTYVSAGRTFRKVQLINYGGQTNGTSGTFGVGGQGGTVPDSDFLTGYIELGWEGSGYPAPVVRM
jgi:hypothetical protein